MPVVKCPNGKWRIGSGPCVYKNKASAEKAYKGYLGRKDSNANKSRNRQVQTRG